MAKGVYKRKCHSKNRHSRLYKEWRQKVLERDHFTCQLCGETKNLCVHHLIRYERKDTRLLLKNGLTLCNSCHISKMHKPGKYLRKPEMHYLDMLNKELIKYNWNK